MQTQPTQTQAAVAQRGPEDWKHDLLRLKIGRNHYTFRTLSLLDAMEVEPHIGPLFAAIAAGDRPLEYARRVAACLKILCPTLLEKPDDLAELTPMQGKALVEFYSAQDWSRVLALRALKGKPGGESADESEMDERTTFYLLTAAGAKQDRCSVMEFMDARLEHCCDVLMSLYQQWAAGEAEKPKPSDLLQFMAAAATPTEYDPAAPPDWIKATLPNKES